MQSAETTTLTDVSSACLDALPAEPGHWSGSGGEDGGDKQRSPSTAGVMNDWSTATPSSKSLSSSYADKDDSDEQCGWGSLQPRACQVFRNAKVVLFFFCCLATIQGMVVNGFVSVVISTIERRFELSSKQSGFVASGYDIASVLCLIPVSYIGGRGHKPHWIAAGVLLLSIGSFLFALPHFVADFYRYDKQAAGGVLGPLALCHSTVLPVDTVHSTLNASSSSEAACDGTVSGLTEASTSILSGYMFVLVIAQMCHGAGATPIYTLAVTYLDDCLKAKVTPLYLGIFYTTAIVGPAIGYIAGGKLLEIYCDVGSVDLNKIDLTPSDPQWIGAWWIGFLISGTLSFLIAVPISAFPKSIPVSKKTEVKVASETEFSPPVSSTNPGFLIVRDIPSTLRSLLCNPTFMSLNMAGACEGLLVSGFIVFAPKFVEAQFGVTAAWAAQLIGFATIPAGGGGTLFGGYLVKRLSLGCKGILRLCLITTGTVLLLTLMLLARCDNVPFAGINVDYVERNRSLTQVNLTAACNAHCHCTPDLYEPVCGADNVVYFSACYAGCHNVSIDRKVYNNCDCVATETAHAAGRCDAECRLLSVFLVIFALIIFVTFTTSMPALAATLRCVPEQQRSFALGIQWILFRTLGMIPAPILFGLLIDQACLSWRRAACSGDKGACLVYDNWAMGSYLLVLIFACKGLSFAFFVLATCLYQPQHVQAAVMTLTIPESLTSATVASSELQPIAADEHDKRDMDKT